MSLPRYPRYKDSGVPWFGEVPDYWEVKALKWLIDRNDGGVWGDDPDGVSDTVVLRSTEQTVNGNWRIDGPAVRKLSDSEKAQALLKSGDLLVTKSSGSSLHIGKTTLVTDSVEQLGCCYSNFMQRVRLSDYFLPKLAWYVMNNDLARLQFDLASNSTTGLANLNGTMIGELIVPNAPIAEQAAIVAFLDRETGKIDALIAEQEKLLTLLAEKRQATISHAVTKGLNPAASMKSSGVEWLGEVPAHWQIKRLKHIGAAIIGLTYDPSAVVSEGEGVLVLRSSNVQQGRITFDDNVYVLTDIPEKLRTIEGDILICSRNGSRNLIGKNAQITERSAGLTFGAFMTVFRSEFNSYLSWVFNSQIFSFQSATFLTSTINQLTTGNLYSFEIPLPSEEEQKAICVFLSQETDKLDALTTEATRAIDLLKERRTALISAAVTGKIDVRTNIPQEAR